MNRRRREPAANTESSPFVNEALGNALKHHLEGRLEEAETVYKRILELEPDNPTALNHLGALAYQAGKPDEASKYIAKALRRSPRYAAAHNNLGLALYDLGKLDDARRHFRKSFFLEPSADASFNLGNALSDQGIEDHAIAAYRRATDLEPDFAEAHCCLGNLLRIQGNAEEAIASYRRAIELDPDQFAAQNNLGNMLIDQGAPGEAIACFQLAIKTNANDARVHNNLGNALYKQYRSEEAIASYSRAIEIDPSFTEAHNNLGNALKDQGKLDDAEAVIRKALELKPDYAEAYNSLGVLLGEQGNSVDAEASYRKALELNPDYAMAYNNLGVLLGAQGNSVDAEAVYRKALELNPDYAEAYNNLGNALKSQGKLEDAMASYQKAVSLKPDYAEAYNSLGVLLGARGNSVDAEATYRKALELKPDYAEAYNNLGNALKSQGKLEDAMASYRKALELNPDYAMAYNNLGVVFEIQGNCVDAEATYRKALELKPDYALAHNNLGNALREQGKLEDARASYRKALELNPEFVNAHSNLLFSLNYDDRISQKDIFDESRRWDEAHGAPQSGRRRRHANSRDAERRLRIGYISPDFREHSVSYFLGPLIAGHDRSRFEVFCYAEVANPDDTTARYRGLAAGWHSTVGEKDSAIAARIQEDGIDILVDLAGHTADNRQLVFAARPAPVQVAWLGYPNTTGQSAMDYRLSDAIADPEGADDALYSETLVRLPNGFLCYGPPADAPEIAGSPALDSGHVTFGSFNNLPKVTPQVVEAWARILDAVPGSRLLIKSRPLADEETRARYLDMFAAHGTDTGRIELLSWISSESRHLGAYGRVDIGLDPFPYNGTTTTCEAMWMGVPVITLSGDRHSGRVGASILTRVGLTEFITGTAAAYVEAAMKLANDRDRLSELRDGLRRRLQGSLLCDGAAFTRDVEAAYRDMWRQWCAGEQASGS